MKENSIERDIHLLESYAGMTHKMNDNQGRPKLDQAIEHILSDYKKVLKQNEQLSTEVNSLKKENKTLKNFVSGIINENIEKDFIPAQKVKDKIEEVRKMKFRDYSLNGTTIDFAIMKFRELLEKE